jgi:hypothetical protein
MMSDSDNDFLAISKLSDNKYFDIIMMSGIEYTDPPYIFNNSRIGLMNQLYGIMILNNKISLKFGKTSLHVSSIIEIMISSCQIEALDSLY